MAVAGRLLESPVLETGNFLSSRVADEATSPPGKAARRQGALAGRTTPRTLLVHPPGPGDGAGLPGLTERSADHAAGNLGEWNTGSNAFDAGSCVTASAEQAYSDSYSAKASVSAAADTYAGSIWNTSVREGHELWFGGAFYLPTGTYAAAKTQLDLFRCWSRGAGSGRCAGAVHQPPEVRLHRLAKGESA